MPKTRARLSAGCCSACCRTCYAINAADLRIGCVCKLAPTNILAGALFPFILSRAKELRDRNQEEELMRALHYFVVAAT